MNKIHKLPEHIISRIAAGEVIERPVYAVKELVENAIDANADNITINIEESGLTKIAVIDNGEGMSEGDLKESFKSHTTSKINGETLSGIKTLGFRGEALSSISSISNMIIASKVHDSVGGTEVSLKSGIIESVRPIGMPTGTSVTVSNLFYTVPARKKFLKSALTEYRHILEYISSLALAYPSISFQLFHNGRELLHVSKVENSEQRLKQLITPSIAQHIIPVNFSDSYVTISGFLTRPQISTKSQNKSTIFINNRKVTDKMIALAIKDAYGTLLENDSYPIYHLFINMPFEAVDVNVHPRKEMVTFVDSKFVFDTVQKAVQKTLSDNNLTFFNLPWDNKTDGGTKTYAAEVLRQKVLQQDIAKVGRIKTTEDILQIHNLYLLIETENGFLLVDQHGAHERILYEEFLKEFNNEKKNQKSFELQSPITIELSLSDQELLKEHKSLFQKMGFEIEKFKASTWRINKVPQVFKDRDIEVLIHEMLDQMHEEQNFNIDSLSKKMLAYLSCRSAIMAGQKLLSKDARKIIKTLFEVPNYVTCPHGRPTCIEMSLKELNKLFKRS